MAEISLTTLEHKIAPIIGLPYTTLYERQRELVRGGLLKGRPGRGRGSGVIVTPTSVATLITAFLASLSLAGASNATQRFFNAKHETNKCELTGAKTFGAAVIRLFEDPSLCKGVSSVEVQITCGVASIERAGVGSRFIATGPKTSKGILCSTALSGDQLSAIAALLT